MTSAKSVDTATARRRRPASWAGSAPARAARPARSRGAAGQRPTPQKAQHVRVAPLALDAARPELAAQQRAVGECLLQLCLDPGNRHAPARRGLGRQERAVMPRPPREQPAQGVRHWRQERLRHARWWLQRPRHRDSAPASSVAIQRCSPAMRTCTARRSAARASSHSPAAARRDRSSAPRTRAATSSARQIAQAAQEVVHLVGRPCGSVAGQRLQLQLELGQRVGVEQLAQLLGAEQLAQQVAVERQRLRAPVGQRRVALVHVRGDVVEHQRAGERRRAARLDTDERDLAPLDRGQDAPQRGQVEDVLQAFAVRLEDDRERCHSGWPRPAAAPSAGASATAASAGRRAAGAAASARAAFSRKWLENSADPPNAPTTSSSISSGSISSGRLGRVDRRRRAFPRRSRRRRGSRTTMPSSDQIGWTSKPRRSRSRASIASAHGAWTRAPNGVSRQIRQSPSSSRKRSQDDRSGRWAGRR